METPVGNKPLLHSAVCYLSVCQLVSLCVCVCVCMYVWIPACVCVYVTLIGWAIHGEPASKQTAVIQPAGVSVGCRGTRQRPTSWSHEPVSARWLRRRSEFVALSHVHTHRTSFVSVLSGAVWWYLFWCCYAIPLFLVVTARPYDVQL